MRKREKEEKREINSVKQQTVVALLYTPALQLKIIIDYLAIQLSRAVCTYLELYDIRLCSVFLPFVTYVHSFHTWHEQFYPKLWLDFYRKLKGIETQYYYLNIRRIHSKLIPTRQPTYCRYHIILYFTLYFMCVLRLSINHNLIFYFFMSIIVAKDRLIII